MPTFALRRVFKSYSVGGIFAVNILPYMYTWFVVIPLDDDRETLALAGASNSMPFWLYKNQSIDNLDAYLTLFSCPIVIGEKFQLYWCHNYLLIAYAHRCG